jgi:SulP family sulfate permease
MARFAAEGAPDDLLAPVIIIIALAAALTGLLLCRLGLARAGGAIRFIPYPVIGGFLGATGCLMVSGAVRVITDHGIGISTMEVLLDPSISLQACAGDRYCPCALPRLAASQGQPLRAAQHLASRACRGASCYRDLRNEPAQGWLFKAPAAVGLTPTWDFADLRAFPWKYLPGLSGDLFAVMFVMAISTLLNTTGIEFVTSAKPTSSAS